jgi:hypothetical protein
MSICSCGERDDLTIQNEQCKEVKKTVSSQLQQNPPDEHYDKSWHIPPWVRKYRLVNNWIPSAIYIHYRLFEATLRRRYTPRLAF